MSPRDMLYSRDWQSLAEIACELFGCNIGSYEIERACGHSRFWPPGECGDILPWLKNRVANWLIPLGADEREPKFKTEFHVFFLFLDETEEMLELLRKPEPKEEREQVARSKIFQTNLIPVPVDRVATRCSDARMLRQKYQRLRERRLSEEA